MLCMGRDCGQSAKIYNFSTGLVDKVLQYLNFINDVGAQKMFAYTI